MKDSAVIMWQDQIKLKKIKETSYAIRNINSSCANKDLIKY